MRSCLSGPVKMIWVIRVLNSTKLTNLRPLETAALTLDLPLFPGRRQRVGQWEERGLGFWQVWVWISISQMVKLTLSEPQSPHPPPAVASCHEVGWDGPSESLKLWATWSGATGKFFIGGKERMSVGFSDDIYAFCTIQLLPKGTDQG